MGTQELENNLNAEYAEYAEKKEPCLLFLGALRVLCVKNHPLATDCL
jgi:hypothetical protein